MKCSEFKKNLHQFADNTLDEHIRQSAEIHLKQCQSCTEELNSLKTLLQCLAKMPVPEKSDEHWEKMAFRICSEIKQISNSKDFSVSYKQTIPFSRSVFEKWSIAALILISSVTILNFLFFDKVFSKKNTAAIQDISLLKIVELKGQVFSGLPSDTGTNKSLDENNLKVPGKTIKTAESSTLRLQTDENSFLDVAEKTALLVNECNQKKQAFMLKEGTVTAQVNKRKSGQTYHISTPNASCEVVGTKFSLSYQDNPDPKKSQTTLYVLEGRVLFVNAKGLSTMVDSGFYAVANHDTIIMPPVYKESKSTERSKIKNEFRDTEPRLTNLNQVNTPVTLSKASSLMESGDLDEAIKELRKISSNQSLPNNTRISALQKESRCWKMKKDYKQAIKSLQMVYAQADSDKQKESALFQIASIQRSEIHDFTSAINYFKQYLSDFPQGMWAEEACITLAELYQLQKDYQKSSELYHRFISQYPNSFRIESVLYSLARIYSRDLQDCNSALGIYSQIESQFPNSSFAEDALFWKAECFFQLKRISQSVSVYKQYLNKYPNGKWVTEAQIRSGYKMTAGTDR